MAEKFDQLSMDDMKTLASSPAGQQLLNILQQSCGAQMQQAMARAAAGDLAGARDLLSPILADPQVRTLLGRLGGK